MPKSMGTCAASWAFAAIAGLESSHCTEGNELFKLSEQQLVDCSTGFGNKGCEKGTYFNSWKYA